MRALASGVTAGAIAIAGIFVVDADNHAVFHSLLSGRVNLADASWAHAIGVVLLFAFVGLAFVAVVIPAPATELPT